MIATRYIRRNALTSQTRQSGQAMVEFAAALIAITVLFAALLQIGLLTKRHTDTMIEARRKAGVNAIAGGFGARAPEYIRGWTDGRDGMSYSADDEMERGSAVNLSIGMVRFSEPNTLGAILGPNMVSTMWNEPRSILWGLQDGYAEDSVPLIPVIRRMVYADDAINLECQVWMTEGGDLY